MTNVLMIYGRIEPTNIMLTEALGTYCRKMKIGFKSCTSQKVKKTDLQWCDIIWCIRGQSILEVELLKIAKRYGRKVVAVYDDDFQGLKDYKMRRPLHYRSIDQILRYCDYIVSGNDHLGRKLEKKSKYAKYVRIDTVVEEKELFCAPIKNDETIRIVYYVNDGAQDSFNEVILPAIDKMTLSAQKKIEWIFLTVHPNMEPENRFAGVHYIPHCSLMEFRRILREGNFTYGIAPLLEDSFSKAKYINKFMEYSMAGLSCIYSDVEPYHSFIQNGETGILCENIPEAWLAAMEQMKSAQFRKKCICQAQNVIREEFSEEVIFRKLCANMPELGGFKASEDRDIKGIQLAKIKYGAWCGMDFLARMYRRFKLEGLRSVWGWILKHYLLRR